MRLLNTKSILECNEYEEEIHNKEIELIVDKICKLENYNCAIVFKCKDIAHQNEEDVVKACSLYDFMEMVEYADAKNGIDFAVEDNGVFVIVVYGTRYEQHGIESLIETHIHVMPYNENKEFISLGV